MKDYVKAEVLRSSIQKALSKSKRGILVPRPKVVNISNLPESFEKFKLKRLESRHLFGLAIGSWYLGEIGIILRLDLEEELSRRPMEDSYASLALICINHEAEMVCFLLETNLWHSRNFFGNILPLVTESYDLLKIQTSSSRVKRAQRKRGYNDHGGITKEPFRKKARAFWLDTIEQLQIYENRDIREHSTELIRGLVS